MYSDSIRYGYTGSALPGNAEVVVLLATAATSGSMSGVIGPPPNGVGNYSQTYNVHRVVVDITNDQTGTIKIYQSMNRGSTWVRAYDDIAVAAPAANSTNSYDILVEPFADWKIEWTNGAAPQTTWRVNLTSTSQRVVAV